VTGAPFCLIGDSSRIIRCRRKMSLNLIFVHVWKTGGMSLGKAFQSAFSAEAVHEDIDNLGDPTSQVNIDPDGYLRRHHQSGYAYLVGKKAITGHFWIRKFDPIRADIRGTILRDPIKRAISNYYYWLSFPASNNIVLRYVVDNKLSFEEYARLPVVRGVYRKVFFRDVDMAQFDFIGRAEELAENWTRVITSLGLPSFPPEERINETQSLRPDYSARAQEILENPAIMSRLRDIFASDIRFYERYAR
jgi:hypothetical protein